MLSLHLIFALLQAAPARPTEHAVSDYAVQAAFLLLLGMNGWVIRTTANTREMVRSIELALFGRKGDTGIEHTVEEHSGELQLLDGRLSRAEDRLEVMQRIRGETQPRNRSHRQ